MSDEELDLELELPIALDDDDEELAELDDLLGDGLDDEILLEKDEEEEEEELEDEEEEDEDLDLFDDVEPEDGFY